MCNCRDIIRNKANTQKQKAPPPPLRQLRICVHTEGNWASVSYKTRKFAGCIRRAEPKKTGEIT